MLVLIVLSVSVLAPTIAYYISKYRKKNDALAVSGLIGIACIVIFMIKEDKFEAEPKSWFFQGYLYSKEVPYEEENGSITYKEKTFFKPYSQIDRNVSAILEYTILLCLFGSVAYSSYRLLEKDNNKTYDEGHEPTQIVLSIAVATSLIICLLNMPYWYYNVVRILAMCQFGYQASLSKKNENFVSWAFFVALTILFNPIWIISFEKLIWNVIDICSAIILLSWATKKYIDSR